ncbi:MAG TPA: MFS transporter [Acidimicrobiales bacterium]|nr:MFS transporter [Acidimicrobiales bacterium]
MALTSLRPLRSRNFAVLWSSALVSNIGSWMQSVALGVLVTARTHNALWTGLVAAAAFLPMGLLAPVGGAVADRLDRRRWLILTTLGEAGFATVLAVLAAGHAHPWALVLAALFGGVCASIGFPAYQAMLPDLVPREDLLAAVSLSSAQFNLGRVVGPALAGVVVVAGSAAWAFAINAVSFGAVVIALLLLRLPRHEPPAVTEPMFTRIVAGARVAWAEPGCRSAIVLIGVVALIGSPFIALVPAVSIKGLHAGGAGTAALVTGQGVGAVIGALALAGMARALGRRRLLVRAVLAFPVTLVCYGLAPTIVPAVVAIVVVGACYIGVLSGLNTVVQLRAPTEARARVLSVYMMALGTIYPLGAIVQGALAQALGIHVVTVASGVVLGVVMLAVVRLAPNVVASLDDPVPEGAPTDPPGPEPADVLPGADAPGEAGVALAP